MNIQRLKRFKSPSQCRELQRITVQTKQRMKNKLFEEGSIFSLASTLILSLLHHLYSPGRLQRYQGLAQPPALTKGVAQLTASTASRAAGGSPDQKSRKGHRSVNDISNLNSSWAPQRWSWGPSKCWGGLK